MNSVSAPFPIRGRYRRPIGYVVQIALPEGGLTHCCDNPHKTRDAARACGAKGVIL